MPVSRSGVTLVGNGDTALGGDLDLQENDINSVNRLDSEPLDGNIYGRKNSAWIQVAAAGSGIAEAPVDGRIYMRKGSDTSWQSTAVDAQTYGIRNGQFALIPPGGFVPIADANLDMANFSIEDATQIEVDTVTSRAATDLLLDAPIGQNVKLGKHLNADGLAVEGASNLLVNTSNQVLNHDFQAVGLTGTTINAQTSIEVGCGGRVDGDMSFQASVADTDGGTNQTVGSEQGQQFIASWAEAATTRMWMSVNIPFDVHDNAGNVFSIRVYEEGPTNNEVWQVNQNSVLETDVNLVGSIAGFALGSDGFPKFDLTPFNIVMTKGKKYGWSVDATIGMWTHRLTDTTNPFTTGVQSDRRNATGGPANLRDHIRWNIETCPIGAASVVTIDASAIDSDVPVLAPNFVSAVFENDSGDVTVQATGDVKIDALKNSALTSYALTTDIPTGFVNNPMTEALDAGGYAFDSMGNLTPAVANTSLLGTTILPWSSGYVGNMSTYRLIARVHATHDIASNSTRYRNAWLSGTLNAAGVSITGPSTFTNVINTRDIEPISTLSEDIGTGVLCYRKAFINTLYGPDNASNTITFGGHFLPESSGAFDIGQSGAKCGEGHYNGALYAPAFNVTSDEDLKGPLTAIPIGLAETFVDALQPMTFNYNAASGMDQTITHVGYGAETSHASLLAANIDPMFIEGFLSTMDDGTYRLNHDHVIPLIVSYCKNLKILNTQQSLDITTLLDLVSVLTGKVAALEVYHL